MYGLNKEVDLSFFLGNELIQVCIGLHQLILNFSGDISISIECEFFHLSKGRALNKSSELLDSARSLLSTLGCCVTDINNLGNGNLEIKLSNGDIIQINDSNEDYESYSIITPNENIIV